MEVDESDSVPQRPVPVPDDLSAPFWRGAAEGRLVIQMCPDCALLHHPPVALCPRCGSETFEYSPVSGRGTVYSFTVTRDARNPAFRLRRPYVVAWIELAEQSDLRLICNMPLDDVDAVSIGADVEVFFDQVAAGVAIPQFRLV